MIPVRWFGQQRQVVVRDKDTLGGELAAVTAAQRSRQLEAAGATGSQIEADRDVFQAARSG